MIRVAVGLLLLETRHGEVNRRPYRAVWVELVKLLGLPVPQGMADRGF